MTEEIKQNDSSNLSQISEEKKSSALHIFLYLLLFSSLGFILQGIISIYYQLIEKVIKPSDVDKIRGCIETNFDPSSLKFGIAALLVSFFIYHILSLFINRKLINGDIKQESLVRKFATYLSMFILAAMTIGGIIALFLNYFEGALSTKSFAKIGVLIGFSLTYLCFYLWEIRRKNLSGKIFNILMIISLAVSIATLIIGFAISDNPRVAREKKMDNALVENIQDISDNVSDFINKEKGQLPKQEDFKTKEGVTYKKLDDKSFELCATFKQSAGEIEYGSNVEYRHPSGDNCFKYNVKCLDSTSDSSEDKCSVEIEKADDIENTCSNYGDVVF